MTHALWPSIGSIRSALASVDAAPTVGSAHAAIVSLPGDDRRGETSAYAAPDSDAALLLPLTDLARRRQEVVARAFNARWAPGRLLSVLHEGRMLGVLLDRCVDGVRWDGWMAASEADWAGPFDVLLEPDDEPFEPAFGLIQTWNVLSVQAAPQLCARVVGEISATRLAALRAVHDEWADGMALPIEPAPGRIALRTVAGSFSVLSGTPLATDDPRAEYQAAYRDAGLHLSRVLQDAPSGAAVPPARQQPDAGSLWRRLGRWFVADALVRPAFALLALVVVAQNAGLWPVAGGDEELRFRNLPASVSAPAAVDLIVRWKPGVQMDDARRLLQAASAEVVGGPDAQGDWQLRLNDPVRGRERLAASALVDSVRAP